MSAFDSEKRRDLAGIHDPLDVGRRGRVFDLIVVRVEQRLHGIPQIQGPAYGLRTWKIHGHPQRKERRVRAALVQPWNVHVTDIPPFAQVFPHHQDALNRVNVAVNSNRLRGEPARSCGNVTEFPCCRPVWGVEYRSCNA